jgi:hypothetical protein
LWKSHLHRPHGSFYAHLANSPAGTSEISQLRSGWLSANKYLRPEGTLENAQPFRRALRHEIILRIKSSHFVAG